MSEKAKESMTRIRNLLDEMPSEDAQKVAEHAATFAEGLALGVRIGAEKEVKEAG